MRRRRLIVLIVVSLVVGVIVNWVVAARIGHWWSLAPNFSAAWDEQYSYGAAYVNRPFAERTMTFWQRLAPGTPERMRGDARPRRYLTDSIYTWDTDSYGHDWTPDELRLLPSISPGPGEGHQRFELSTGWPMIAFEGWVEWDGNHRRWKGKPHRSHGLLFEVPRLSRMAPLAPVFPGFLVNTLVYGAMAFPLLLGLSYTPALGCAVIRRRRLTNGLCPTCKYDIGDAELCSECGWTREVGL